MLHFVRRPLVSSIILRICVDRGRPFFLLTEGGTIGGSWGRGQCRLSGTGWKSGDVLLSLFMNELYGFQLDNHRWYPLELRKEKSTKDKQSKGCKRNERSNDSQDDMEMPLQSEMDDNTEDSEEAAGSQCDVSNVSNHLTKNLSLNAVSSTKVSDAKVQGLIGDCDKQQSTLPEVVKPCGRINSCMVVGKDALYLYGGMMEIKDREITLDDLYSLNLSKLDEWKCIIPASESEWQDISEDEDEEEDEDDDDGTEDDESDDGSDTSEADDDDDDIVCDVNGKKTLDMSTAVSLLKGEKKNLRRKEKRARIEQIRVTLGLSDSQRTPTPGETLRDFYRRTSMYWQMAAHEHTQHTGKELRKDGFDLAEARYKELKPILDELAILEAEQKAEEEAGAETSSRKKVTKKNNRKNPAK
ncbi:kelch repeat-containing protein 3-like isoform X6 [Ananas comosus]|uniref:Kelch repeat-containing protein 3-like isoform X6 n=1 Tax=Ananas comosus TaxID=4615 RepID=A0A6P5H1B5_ANACO|nr:kelch repeat-containing protein 3-like isoform X6 [Ananas comosus]